MARRATADPSVLSVGEAARRLRVSTNEVRRLCDQKHLACWRVPGNSLDRRIERAEVERFAAACGIPAFDPRNPNGV